MAALRPPLPLPRITAKLFAAAGLGRRLGGLMSSRVAREAKQDG